MLAILQNLEPRFERKGLILYNELEEISEIFFVSKGSTDIGYQVNKKPKFVIRYTDKTMVGAYNVSFNKRSLFIYKCSTDCHGYFIRKQKWVSILSQDKDIETFINQNVEKWYINQIKRKVLQLKEKDLMKMSIRKDFDCVYTVSNKDKNGNPYGGVNLP